MVKIVWLEQFSVNVKLIDEQHKRFIGYMNDAYDHIGKKTMPGELNALFDELSAHANEHFATEEKYFVEYNYENAAQHTKEHDKIKADILSYKECYNKGGSPSIIFDVIDFLEEWLLTHIMEYDKKYTKCFNEHGLY